LVTPKYSKSERYLKFGWFGARADDVMNTFPARFTWMLMTLVSAILPGYSGKKCFIVGLQQHGEIPGPNAGWSECAAAGSLRIKIAGPIYKEGVRVNEKWLGYENDPEGGSVHDVGRMNRLALFTVFFFVLLLVPVFIIHIISG